MDIKEAYNVWSRKYDSNDNKTRDLDKKVTQRVLSKYNFNKVLEMGCGTGKNTLWFSKNSKKVHAVDFSTKMLQKAKEKIKEDNVKFTEADITKNWNIPTNSIDLVSFNLILEHIDNLDFVFNQTYNVLNEKGLLFISELHPIKQYLGSKARFETQNGVQELTVFTHHISDYILSAEKNGFQLLVLNEWFDEENTINVPRLISFVFQKTLT